MSLHIGCRRGRTVCQCALCLQQYPTLAHILSPVGFPASTVPCHSVLCVSCAASLPAITQMAELWCGLQSAMGMTVAEVRPSDTLITRIHSHSMPAGGA